MIIADLSRRKTYVFAWILFVAGILLSGTTVLGDLVFFARQTTSVPPVRFVGLLFLSLSVFTNLIFAFTLVVRNAPSPSIGWRVLLIGSFVVNASMAFFFRYAEYPGYWPWLLSFAVVTYALIALPPSARQASPPGTKKLLSSAAESNDVPSLLWAWIGWMFFWLIVTAVAHFVPQRHVNVAMTPPLKFSGYVFDASNTLGSAEVDRVNALLSTFEKETSNQVAVAMYPELPRGESLEDFTVRMAEAAGVGDRNRDNGAILFVFLREHLARIEVGYGLEGVLTDAASYGILSADLAGNFARGDFAGGIDQALASVTTRIRSEYRAGRMPGKLRVTWARLCSVATEAGPYVWPFLRDSTTDQRVGISFFGTLIGFGIGDGFANAARIIRNLARAARNVARRRQIGEGMVVVQLDSLIDTLKLAAIALIPLAGLVVLIAGGGHFGGAGAYIHW